MLRNVFWSIFRNWLNKGLTGRHVVYNPYIMFVCLFSRVVRACAGICPRELIAFGMDIYSEGVQPLYV